MIFIIFIKRRHHKFEIYYINECKILKTTALITPLSDILLSMENVSKKDLFIKIIEKIISWEKADLITIELKMLTSVTYADVQEKAILSNIRAKIAYLDTILFL